MHSELQASVDNLVTFNVNWLLPCVPFDNLVCEKMFVRDSMDLRKIQPKQTENILICLKQLILCNPHEKQSKQNLCILFTFSRVS